MICIGNQTACWAATPLAPFDYALANGFDAFEWFPDKKPGAGWDDSDLDESQRGAIRETALMRGLRQSVHARWQANPLQAESYPLFWQDLKLADDLGAVLLNLHLYHEAGIPAYVEAITPLVKRTAEAGLQLSIENTPHHSPEHFNELFTRLRSWEGLPTDHVGMCLDLGHANLCSATHNDYLRFFDRLDPQLPIIHLHFHENWGDGDTHLPLFTGPAGRDDSGIRRLLERLRRRHFYGSIILEQWPHPPSLLNNARDRLLELLKAPIGEAEDSNAPRQSSGPSPLTPSVERSAELCVGAIELGLSNAPKQSSALRSEGSFAEALVAADKRCRSWREKLDFVRELLTQSAAPPTSGQLADVAIYLQWLGTGEIPCAEDGRHFRPAHHARIALDIQERLASLTTPDNAWIVRRIYPWLPSSARSFQRAEPLTRIRAIAHRNDIPSDLKREIKHSLQNKLHRCAGPEDLVTSSALLKRVAAPGANYPRAFVDEFKIFHEELKEFFNARSLEERLEALLPAVGVKPAILIRSFLNQKAAPGLAEQLATLGTLTELRRSFLDTVKSLPSAEAHEILLADIALEDFAFVLASDMINALDAPSPGARRSPAAATEASWESLLDTLPLTITNLALSNVAPEESRAIEAELHAWRQKFDPANHEHLLRLKASAARCRRLAEDYTDQVLALFPQRVAHLGRALGVAQHVVQVFCEAEIRRHLIFQLSKLVSIVLRRIRSQLALPPWEILVSGQAVGHVKTARSLDQLGRGFPEPVVVLLDIAEGDEEIPNGVVGIVLGHPIPHLSHLGVRARQAGVVFVASEEAESLDVLRHFEGQKISLVASPENVSWQPATDAKPALNRADRPHVSIPPVRFTPERPSLPLDQALADCAGGKADGARRLAELARHNGAGFETSPGLVVPFGVMEAALRATPGAEAEYGRLLSQVDGMRPEDLAAAAGRLQDLIRQAGVPNEIAAEATRRFGQDTRLIVRSSANCEDLDRLAAAGLYESVANVAPVDVAAVVRQVWSSLWTPRAALSRKQAGIPHQKAHMAVLIQRMLAPDYSFVLHTVNPVNHNPRQVYAELAVGLGETLVSAAARGNPYRTVCDTDSGSVTILAFANFSQALSGAPLGGVTRRTVAYSRIALSYYPNALKTLARRLAAVARLVEKAFQKPLDIEGAVVGNDVYLVQARPQQLNRGAGFQPAPLSDGSGASSQPALRAPPPKL